MVVKQYFHTTVYPKCIHIKTEFDLDLQKKDSSEMYIHLFAHIKIYFTAYKYVIYDRTTAR